MKSIYFLALIAAVLLIGACKKDDEKIFFNFKVKEYSDNNDRSWIMVYNASGTLLGIKELINNSTLVFDWPDEPNKSPDGKYLIQIFTKYTGNSTMYYLSCYTDITPATWVLGGEPYTEFNPIGQNRVTITGIDLANVYFPNIENGFTSGYVENSNTNCFLIDQYFNPCSLYLSYRADQTSPIFFKWIPDATLNQQFTYDVSDMNQAGFVNINLPANTYCTVELYSEAVKKDNHWEGYYIGRSDGYGENTIKVYNPAEVFTGYQSNIDIYNGNIWYSNVKINGSIPTSFEQMQGNIIVSNNNLQSLGATSESSDADYQYYNWIYNNANSPDKSFWYTLYAPVKSNITYSAPALPDQIWQLDENMLNLDSLKFAVCGFYDFDNILDYNDYISKLFVRSSAFPRIKANAIIDTYKSKSFYPEMIDIQDLKIKKTSIGNCISGRTFLK